MATRLYYKSKKILKKYYLLLLILIVFIITMCIPIPYIIESPGGLIDLNTRIVINSKYKSKGTLNLTYVSQNSATIFTYLMSKVNTSWDALEKKDNIVNDEKDKVMLENSISNATYVAYNALEKKIEITDTFVVVVYIDNKSITNLKVGDIITEVNNTLIHNEEEYRKIVSSGKVGDKLIIKTKEKKEKYIEIQEIDNEENTLIQIVTNNIYNPPVKNAFQETESGASGGLMIALSIYDKLTEMDLTNGKIIAGTGTIDRKGNVGAIDGIKYKLSGAVENEADVFLVPADNYIEARKYKKINNYDIELVSIETFNDAINYLKSEK